MELFVKINTENACMQNTENWNIYTVRQENSLEALLSGLNIILIYQRSSLGRAIMRLACAPLMSCVHVHTLPHTAVS